MVQSTWHKSFICRAGLCGYAAPATKAPICRDHDRPCPPGKPLKVVADQFLTPTSTLDIALALPALLASQKYGLYHMTNAGQCSWHEFAQALFELAAIPANLTPVASSAFPTRPNARFLRSRQPQPPRRRPARLPTGATP